MGKDWDKFSEGKNPAGGTKRGTPYQRNRVAPSFFQYTPEQMATLQGFSFAWATEALRIAKPGAIMLCFGGTRTFHRISCGIEDAGWEIRDTMMWLYGSGFPKSYNISKGIDKRADIDLEVLSQKKALGAWLKEKRGDKPQREIAKHFPSKTGGLTGCVANWEIGYNLPTWETWAKLKDILELDNRYDYLIEGRPKDYIEAERKVVGKQTAIANKNNDNTGRYNWNTEGQKRVDSIDITTPATDQAKMWDGWGTALKPAFEPIIVCMKPRDGTFVENALKHGVAGLNIDGGRVPTEDTVTINAWDNGAKPFGDGAGNPYSGREETKGRFPANIIHDGSEEVLVGFPQTKSGKCPEGFKGKYTADVYGEYANNLINPDAVYGDSGSAARFFYCAKSSRAERNAGLEGEANPHPTVKPLSLMTYLCRLTKTPTGGVVLDPFMGSGTTGMACKKTDRDFIGIEKDEHFFEIATKRIENMQIQKEMF